MVAHGHQSALYLTDQLICICTLCPNQPTRPVRIGSSTSCTHPAPCPTDLMYKCYQDNVTISNELSASSTDMLNPVFGPYAVVRRITNFGC